MTITFPEMVLYMGTITVLIPFVLFLFNFRLITKNSPALFVYICLCLIMEVGLAISLKKYGITLQSMIDVFFFLEALLFLKILLDSFCVKIDKILLAIYIITSLIFIFDIFYSDSNYHSFSRSFSKFSVLTSIIYLFINNRKSLKNYNRTIIFSILFFVTITLPTFAFLDLISNKDITLPFLIINNIANLIYYLLFAYSVIQMKQNVSNNRFNS